ncbi:Gamma-aminobutyric-acid receptor alpha-2 subunit precursor, putative, partial [Gryllus bimaculatus]
MSNDVTYQWKEEDAVVEEGVELAQYDLVNISVSQARTFMRGKDPYSMIKVSFLMKRHTGYFMLQVFAPCILIVCCSWVSFWIDPDAVPARVTLGVTTVLSMTTMGFGGRAQMPKVSYATALDWFVILCFSFVFAVMVEYAVINFIDKATGDIKRVLEEKGVKKPPKVRRGARHRSVRGFLLPRIVLRKCFKLLRCLHSAYFFISVEHIESPYVSVFVPEEKHEWFQPVAEGSAEATEAAAGAAASAEAVVPVLVVDLAPTPAPAPTPSTRQ